MIDNTNNDNSSQNMTYGSTVIADILSSNIFRVTAYGITIEMNFGAKVQKISVDPTKLDVSNLADLEFAIQEVVNEAVTIAQEKAATAIAEAAEKDPSILEE